MSFIGTSSASEGYPCCIESNLDKTEYNPGDIAKITIIGTGEYTNPNGVISIKITDVTFGPEHANVVYQVQKILQDGKAEIEYKTPQSTDRYRYLLTVESPVGVESKIFFTKKDASKIVISDVKILTPKVKQGEQIKLEAKIVDGVGNQIHYLRVSAFNQIPQQSCPEQIIGISGDLSPSYSNQPNYWMNKTINGTISVPNTAKPGIYDLTLNLFGDIEGYSSTQTTIRYEIIENTEKPAPFSVINLPLKVDFGTKFFTEQPISVTGFTAYDGCGAIIPDVPLKAEIKRYDLKKSAYIETLQTREIFSDKNGTFHVSFDPIGIRAGYYSLLLTSTYQGVNFTASVETPHNIKNFTIFEQGKKFTVTVDGWYFIPLNVTFDKENKKLDIYLDTSDSFRRADFKIPSDLVSGKFTVLADDKETDVAIQRHDGYSEFSPWPGMDNHTTIEIIGTDAIPEFPNVILILSIGIFSLIVFYRMKPK